MYTSFLFFIDNINYELQLKNNIACMFYFYIYLCAYLYCTAH